MKVISLLLLSGIAFLNALSTTTEGPDYREKYDHLLMEMINERIRSGEAFIESLSHQLKEFQSSKKEELRQHIVSELEFILPLVKGADQYFEKELKKTGLDLSEKYSVEKAKALADVVVKLLTEVETLVKKPVFEMFAVTEAPIDYRKEYDRLLYQTIQDRIVRADGALLFLNRQLDEYLKTKSADLKQRIVNEIEVIVPLLKNADEHLKDAVKRTDLNHLERFLYEKADDEVLLLLKHFSQIETSVKATLFAGLVVSTASPNVDWREEYDRLLFAMIEENVRKADGFLVELERQYSQYLETKNNDLLERIKGELDFTVPMVKNGVSMAEKELKRSDLNHIERYLYEKIRDEANILLKYFTQLENELKGH